MRISCRKYFVQNIIIGTKLCPRLLQSFTVLKFNFNENTHFMECLKIFPNYAYLSSGILFPSNTLMLSKHNMYPYHDQVVLLLHEIDYYLENVVTAFRRHYDCSHQEICLVLWRCLMAFFSKLLNSDDCLTNHNVHC